MQTTNVENSNGFTFASQNVVSSIFPVIRDKRHSNFSTQNPQKQRTILQRR